MAAVARVRAPARLHFGLIRFAQRSGPSYGGLGMMIDSPALEIVAEPQSFWQAEGPGAVEAEQAARHALAAVAAPRPFRAARLTVAGEIHRHSGLGSGTQLALAAAAAIHALADRPCPAPELLARCTGRGNRSAIGAHGFRQGGLLWERGREPGAALAPLAARAAVPADWRVVIALEAEAQGVSGERERAAFRRLPPIPSETTERLQRLAERQILPATSAGDFATFGETLYEFGRLAGECYRSIQGGPYATPLAADRVAALRRRGVRGAGQSSWGPALFAMAPDPDQAAHLLDGLRADPLFAGCRSWIARADNAGAVVTRDPAPAHVG